MRNKHHGAYRDGSHLRRYRLARRAASLLGALAIATLLPTGGASAQTTDQADSRNVDAAGSPPGPLTLSGEVALVSDYRFRGLSLSDEKVALQPGLTLSHESGFYVSAWGSNIQETAGGADIELDLLAGYATELPGGVQVDAGVVWYLYPGDSSVDYLEGYGSVSITRGALTPKFGVAYAPSQDALGNEDNFYVYTGLEAAIPGTPLTLDATLGYETGAFDAKANGSKLDWQVGVSCATGPATLGVHYIDTDTRLIGGASGRRNLADPTVVASLSLAF